VSDALKEIGFRNLRGHHYGPIKYDKLFEGLRYFCVVRNHWDAFASWYMSKTNNHTDNSLTDVWVEQWVLRQIRRRRSYCVPQRLWYFRKEVPETLCIRFENLEDDLNTLLSLFELPDVSLAHVGGRKRKGKDYRSIHSEGSRQWISYYFHEEIKELGYSY